MTYKVGMISLGCAKNRVDAEMMLFNLRQAGYQIIEEASMADVAIINTCGFIESAKQESIDEILELAQLKKEGKIKAIVVTGCLSERYQEQIMKELYEVDAVVGLGANGDIANIITKCIEGNKVESFPDKLLMPLDGARIQSTPFHYAYLKVADGCDNCCTYCAIPLIRGKFRSRKMEDLIEDAKKLADNGVTELLLIAQDTTRYGEDIYGKLMLPKLLKEICKIDKIKWIRVLYCYPDRVTDELLDVMAQEEKILNYIDLPLQHCSGKILKSMNRSGNKDSLKLLVDKIRTKLPDVVIRTTFITGFPNETTEDFDELSEFVEEVKFERLGCFAYSREEDTKAADFENQIEEEIKQKRQDIIMQQQQYIMEKYEATLKDKIIEVVVEGYDKYASCYVGRSRADAPEVDGKVFFNALDKKIKIGDYVNVLVDDFIDCDPIGTLVE